jgi:hypothetical protein
MKYPTLNQHDKRAWARFSKAHQFTAQTEDYWSHIVMRACTKRLPGLDTMRARAFLGLKPHEIVGG